MHYSFSLVDYSGDQQGRYDFNDWASIDLTFFQNSSYFDWPWETLSLLPLLDSLMNTRPEITIDNIPLYVLLGILIIVEKEWWMGETFM